MICRIEIPGNPITKKNSQKIIRLGNGRTIIKPSDQYEVYASTAAYHLFEWAPRPPLDKPVQVTCVYYMATRRRVDLTNLLEATDDILVQNGILADDSRDVVASHDGSRVYYDKDNPRVIITISDFNVNEKNYTQWSEEAKKKSKPKTLKPSRTKSKVPVVKDFDEDHWD